MPVGVRFDADIFRTKNVNNYVFVLMYSGFDTSELKHNVFK